MDKHIVNDARTLATESLRGLVASWSDLEFEETYRIVKRGSKIARSISKKVQIISGGGSGHEPSFAGMVGTGLLDAAVCGNVFASPNVGQIRRAVELVSTADGSEESMGVLMIVMR
jgi:dihydroxyacetone kinase